MSSKRSRVHPAFKTKYRVGNWLTSDRGLDRRGDLSLWRSLKAIAAWTLRPSGSHDNPCARFAVVPAKRRFDGLIRS